MGKQNRQRRAGKQRKRHGGGRTTPPGSSPGGGGFGAAPFSSPAGARDDPADGVPELVFEAALAVAADGAEALPVLLDALERVGAEIGPGVLARIAADLVIEEVHQLWHRGWQPLDVVGVLRKHEGAGLADLATLAVLDEADGLRADLAMPEPWARQLDTLRADAPAGPPAAGTRRRLDDRLGGGRHGTAPARRAALGDALRVIGVAHHLVDLPQLLPDPCSWPTRQLVGGHRTEHRHLDPGLLAKVRALLAKAESTTFEAEALAFTAKAQELMARHAIDEAVLDHDRGDHDEPEGRRLRVEDPYASEKSLLLGAVAGPNRCRTVVSKELGFSTVFGFGADLDSVELLYTSLLVQANASMLAHGSQRDRTGRSTTRSFRQSFLVGFATRIGERLQRATDDTVAQAAAERGGTVALVPVLAERDERVDEVMHTTFPNTEERRARAGNRSGWVAGQVAGEQASLSFGQPLPG